MDHNIVDEHQLQLCRDLSEELNNWKLLAFNQCHDGSVIFLMIQEDIQYYKIWHLNVESSYSCEVKISKDDLKYECSWTHVDTLPNDRFLVVACRCTRYSDGSTDFNGRIFDKTGNLLRQLLLGDGIEDIKTDKDGFIWASYFDEGIFGHFDWNHPEIIASHGLVKWNDQGCKVYEYMPTDNDLQPIDDCYSINVVDENDVWICYYSQFPFVKISNLTINNYWLHELKSVYIRAIHGDTLLAQKCYVKEPIFFLLQLGSEKSAVKCLRTLQFTDENEYYLNCYSPTLDIHKAWNNSTTMIKNRRLKADFITLKTDLLISTERYRNCSEKRVN
ncbi:unnamed protein product [Rotaria socialis]